MSPGPMTTAHRGGSLYQTRMGAPGRATMLAASAAMAPKPRANEQQWRADQALRQADYITRLARTNVSPDMEPIDPDVNDGDPSREMEPDDPTVDDEDEGYDEEPVSDMGDPTELALRATVSGNEDEVTITAEPGETILGVTEEDNGDLEVLLEDTADVLLAYPSRATVTGDEYEITITADEGEVLDVSDMGDGDFAVHVDEE